MCSKPSSRIVGFLLAIFVLAQISPQTVAQECRDSYSILGMMLKGHIIKTIKTSISLECLRACNDDARCQSFNYVMLENICELNSATYEAKPEYLVASPDRYYVTAKDVDECAQGTHDCPADVASCTNTFGSYSCKVTAPECVNYQSLTEANRKNTNGLVSRKCDKDIGPGWFRFHGDAGTKMPTSCTPINMCDTDATGWLNSAHPAVAEGKVTRQVCFSWGSNCCHWATNIEVRNCGDYFVYYFTTTPGCSLRFCGSD